MATAATAAMPVAAATLLTQVLQFLSQETLLVDLVVTAETQVLIEATVDLLVQAESGALLERMALMPMAAMVVTAVLQLR
jgi:hypothetical protein